MYVNVDVDIDDVLAEMTDDEVQELYDARFGGPTSDELWIEIYENRRAMTAAEFLMHLDVIIMDKTGRIL